MKKRYAKPTVESEAVFEVLVAGCTLQDAMEDGACDPDFGGMLYRWLPW